MDILTEVVDSVRTGRPASVRTDGYAPWGLHMTGTGFHLVLHGSCWLVDLSGATPPVRLSEGDVVFLPEADGHALADDPATPPQDVSADRRDTPIGAITVGADGPRTRLLCGSYHLDRARPHPLLRQVPRVIHLRAGEHPQLTAAVGLLGHELDQPRGGTDGIVAALVDSLLLYVLRAWLETCPNGWAEAMSDPVVARALTAVHDDPATAWTVESLARHSGLSRAPFARRFTALVGEPPLTYLTRWRMTLAARRLRDTDDPLGVVAARAGYGSEYAFAKAFKRDFGIAPGRYRRRVSG
ncbi:AraC family transcriptional regulator [Umezawaea sp. NPDC059074]|uniref:AraC family transcriptional regulator n=1 Tax=Umezawaea sp. NPDC059074 TaxID=3346716 RepID=UPI0036C3E6A3